MEKEEKNYLSKIIGLISGEIEETQNNITLYSKEVREIKDYLWENKADMDHAEKVSSRESVTRRALTGEGALQKLKRLNKLLNSPYFGRVDFQSLSNDNLTIYIGVHAFYDSRSNNNLIYDWRAPISTLFYDYETGPARYISPAGVTEGVISLKRQFRIKRGKMEYSFDSSLNIHDDILQKELGRSSDDRMKNIVATIQREQNSVIRDEKSKVLIIQGAAGSGKTSVALHRIAYLLYRFQEDISADNILIVSPNSVFADYISNVLPELGEENMPETGMAELAKEVLNNKYKFATFFDQISQLIDNPEGDFAKRVRYKSTFSFLSSLRDFLVYLENNLFEYADIHYGRFYVPAFFVEERFRAHSRLPVLNRFKEVAKDIYNGIEKEYKTDLQYSDLTKLTALIKKMFRGNNLITLYQEFYNYCGSPEMFVKPSRGGYEYADLFPMAYIKLFLEGGSGYKSVKHLLIDEMQDYTPVQYALISKLFTCNMTILGDSNQSLDPSSASTAQSIARVFNADNVMTLTKSYRSTMEILALAQKISFNKDLIPMDRHGEEPVINICKSAKEEVDTILKYVKEFGKTSYNSMAIICKTQKQAQKLYNELSSKTDKISLLTVETVTFVSGIVITTSYLAKGLEFDYVVIPFATSDNYITDIDLNMLYIAVTRAMHSLRITASGEISFALKN